MSPAERVTGQLQVLTEAATQYGLVLQVLELVQVLHQRQNLQPNDLKLIEVAATAFVLAKAERLHQGVDLE